MSPLWKTRTARLQIASCRGHLLRAWSRLLRASLSGVADGDDEGHRQDRAD